MESEVIKIENLEMTEEISEIKTKMKEMKREKRRNNIVVQGIEIHTDNQEK